MKIAICSCYAFDPPLEPRCDYPRVTDSLKTLYASRHDNVDYLSSRSNPHPDRDIHFCKFAMLLYAFYKGYDWAIWMDADAAPVRMEFELTPWLGEDMRDNIHLAKDINGWNSGVMIVPNTPRATRWLMLMDSQEVHDKYKDAPFWEQNAIVDSFSTPEYADFPKQLVGSAWNAYEPIYCEYGDAILPNRAIDDVTWVLHIPGYGDAYRFLRFMHELDRVTHDSCPVCGTASREYFAVPFRKGCGGMTEGDDSETWTYCACPNCELVFAREPQDWNDKMFAERIYNEDYARIDPDFCGARASMYYDMLAGEMCARNEAHLDYGGGNGEFSAMLRKCGLRSESYDPYFGGMRDIPWTRQYSMITCLNTLEHCPSPADAFDAFARLLVPGGSVCLMNTLHDGSACFGVEPRDWFVSAPRDGKVCIYGRRTLEYLAARAGLCYRRDKSNDQMQVITKP